MSGAAEWLDRFAVTDMSHDEAMADEVRTGQEPGPRYWEDRGDILERLAYDARAIIGNLHGENSQLCIKLVEAQRRIAELEEGIERVEYAWNGSEYVTGEGVQRLDDAVRSAVNLLPEGE